MDVKITTLCILWVFVLKTAQPCADTNCQVKRNQECFCSRLPCIPTTNPCEGSTSVQFKFSTFMNIQSKAFSNYTDLQSIGIWQEEDVVTIEPNAFWNQFNLKSLRLYFRGSIRNNAFLGLNKLEAFSLKPNFTSIDRKTFSGMGRSLQELTLSRGILSDVQKDSFSEFMNLTKLDLSFNRLTKIKSGWISDFILLEEVILKSNSITQIEMDSFKNMAKLKKLDLSNNNIKMINNQLFNGIISMTQLDLSANKLVTIEPGTFATQNALKMLFLSHNNLQSFSFGDFYQDSKLTVLLLNNNNLTSLVFPTFPASPLKNLNTIVLQANKLTTFPTIVLQRYLRNLTNINLMFNPLTCDCAMSNLSNHFTNFFGDVPDCSTSNQTCFAPSVQVMKSQISARINSNVQLRCSIQGQPYPNVTWLGPKRQSLIGRYNPFTGASWLDLTSITTASLGKYECSATNDEGYDKGVMTVVKHVDKIKLTSTSAFTRTSYYLTAFVVVSVKLV